MSNENGSLNNERKDVYNEFEELTKLRHIVHDIINQVTKFNSLNRAIQRKAGEPLDGEQLEIFKQTSDRATELVGQLRDKIHIMERRLKARNK